MMSMLLALLLLSEPAAVEMYAGHQVVWGQRDIPILGEYETRTDTLVLANVRRVGDTVEVAQVACRVGIADVAGVSTTMTDSAVRRLPPTRFSLAMSRKEPLVLEGAWTSGWDDKDQDDDGEPGLTVSVGASLCSGEVYVAQTSTTRARAEWIGKDLQGEVTVDTKQQVLGASNACLRMGGKKNEDTTTGVFRYVPVPPGTTCDSFGKDRWPVRAAP